MIKNELKKNTDTKAIDSLILNAQQESKGVLVWRIFDGVKILENAKIRVVRKSRNEIVIKCDGNIDEFLNKIISGTNSLNVYIPDDIVLFRSKIKKIEDDGEVVIEYPEEIAQIDRRKYLRVDLKDGEGKLKIILDKTNTLVGNKQESYEFKVESLSASGCSISIGKGQNHIFRDQTKFKHVELSYRDEIYKLEIELKDLKQVSSDENLYTQKQVTMEFINVGSNERMSLNKAIFGNTSVLPNIFD